MKEILRRQISFLFYGFIVWLPLLLTIYIISLLLSNAERAGEVILGVVVPNRFVYFGFGVILWVLIIYFTGMLLKTTSLGQYLSKLPLIGVFFNQGEIMTVSRLSHLQACLFLYSPTCISYGWILSAEKVKLKAEPARFSLVNVYYPSTPALVTGQVFTTRKENVMKLANSSSEIINLLLYTFRSPEAIKYIPWEDESLQEFEKRSAIFGLKQTQ
jgi:uncharacterized membrane protein